MPGTAVGPQHTGGVMIAPSIDYLERAWDEAKYGRPSSRPFSQMFFHRPPRQPCRLRGSTRCRCGGITFPTRSAPATSMWSATGYASG